MICFSQPATAQRNLLVKLLDEKHLTWNSQAKILIIDAPENAQVFKRATRNIHRDRVFKIYCFSLCSNFYIDTQPLKMA